MIFYSARRLFLLAVCLLPLGDSSVEAYSHSKVQLAQVFAGEDVSRYLVSEKYDGVRAIWRNGELRTKNGNLIHAPLWFTENLPDVWLDGELWSMRGDFETVMSAISKHRPVESEWQTIKYMVFDAPSYNDTFSQRSAFYHDLVAELNVNHIQAVKQFEVINNDALAALLKYFHKIGAEGLMLQKADGRFEGGRGGNLLKLKPYMDAEATVIKHLSGKGKYKGSLGSLLVSYRNANGIAVEFKIGSGFTDMERSQPPPIGSLITFKYHGYTKNGIPRFASYLRIRSVH